MNTQTDRPSDASIDADVAARRALSAAAQSPERRPITDEDARRIAESFLGGPVWVDAADIKDMRAALESVYPHGVQSAPFADTADAIEERLRYDSEHACPHCGGSGHKDDAQPAPDASGVAEAFAVLNPELHPSTAALVWNFAVALARKLRDAEKKYGYSDGWRAKDWMDECRTKLVEHVAKGDPRDVAAYCAFLWHHGERTALPAPDAAASSPAGC